MTANMSRVQHNGRTTNSTRVDKAKPASKEFLEVGSTGLVQTGGIVKNDFLRQLQGKQAFANYREMADNDPVVGAMLHAIEMIVEHCGFD